MTVAAIVTPAPTTDRVETVALDVAGKSYPIEVKIAANGRRYLTNIRSAAYAVLAFIAVEDAITNVRAAGKQAQKFTESLQALGIPVPTETLDMVTERVPARLEELSSQKSLVTALMKYTTALHVPVGDSRITPAELVDSKKGLMTKAASSARGIIAATNA